MAQAALKLTRRVLASIDASVLRKETEYCDDFVRAVAEALWNERDAHGTEFVIEFVKRGRIIDLVIWGNGDGVSDEGMDAMGQLMNSPSASDKNKRGKRGSGAKSFCRHASAFKAETLRPKEKHIHQVEFTTLELRRKLANHEPIDWMHGTIPAGHRLKGSGTCVTWIGLGEGDAEFVNPKHPRSAARLVEELARCLNRELVKMVTVIDERGKRHRLAPKKLVGEKIEGSAEIPGIGTVAFDIAVTASVDTDMEQERRDRLAVWTQEPACGIAAFLRRVRKTSALSAFLPALCRVLDHPQVIGQIEVPGWKDYILRGADAGFRQDLFDDEETIFVFLAWLYETIVPKVEAHLGRQDVRAVSDDETARDELVHDFQTLEGAPREDTDTVDLSMLSTTPARVMLECGDAIMVQIDEPAQGTYAWDDRGTPVAVSPRQGARVEIRALQQAGSGHVTLRHTPSNKSRRILVEVANRLEPELTYGVRKCTVGQRITHRLQHTKHLRGKPTWSVQAGHGLIDIASDGLSVVHQIPNTPGTYEVRVQGRLDNGKTFDHVAVVHAMLPGGEEGDGKRTKAKDAAFVFNGQLYEVVVRRFTEGANANACYTDGVVDREEKDPNHRPVRINLNYAHATFACTEAARRQISRVLIALQIAATEERRNPSLGSDFNRIDKRKDAIVAELMKKVGGKN